MSAQINNLADLKKYASSEVLKRCFFEYMMEFIAKADTADMVDVEAHLPIHAYRGKTVVGAFANKRVAEMFADAAAQNGYDVWIKETLLEEE